MKKVFLMAMTVAAVAFTSCGNNAKPNANAEGDSTEVTADSTAAIATANVPEDAKALVGELGEKLKSGDANAVAGMIAGAQAKAAEMVKNNPEKAKEYIAKLQEWIKANAESIQNVVAKAGNPTIATALTSAVSTISSANPDALLQKIADGAEAGKEAVGTAKDAAAEKVNDAKQAAEAKVEEKVTEAKDAAKAKVNEATGQAKEKAAQASEKANKAVNDAANKAIKGLGL